MPMRYFDAWNLKYIWFGPLPFFNKERLRQVRQKNLHVKISLTISRDIITKEEFASIDRFCKRNKIHLVTIENLKKEVLESGNPIEQKLFALMEEELHNPHGNKAAASDILRAHTYFWLDEESAGSGVYLDLDSTVIPPQKQWHELEETNPYLVPFHSLYIDRGFYFANDVIVLTTLNEKLDLQNQKINIQNDLNLVQESILFSYQNPSKKINFNIRQENAFESQIEEKDTIFEIRKKIAELSFEKWATLEFSEYKKYFAKRKIYSMNDQRLFFEYKFTPENPPPQMQKIKMNYSAEHFNNQAYYDYFIPEIKSTFENYDIKIRQAASGCMNPNSLSGINLLKACYASIKLVLQQKSVSDISGVHNFVNPKTIPKEKHLLSIQHHQLGKNYIGQLGIGESFVHPENSTEPDLSWTNEGALMLLKKSKSAAIEVFKKNGLTASGLRAWLKNKKEEKCFTIKLWTPEKQHLTATPPALTFRAKNDLENPGKLKPIKIRGALVQKPRF